MAARIGMQIGLEKATHYRARTLSDVPQSADAITPEWLTKAICKSVPAAAVTSVEVTGGSDGTTARRALTVSYNETGTRAGLPTKLFTKCTPFFRSRLQQASIAKPPCEVGFYNEIRPELDIEATAALYADYDPASGRTIMIFEDIAEARGAKFLDIMDTITREMAENQVRTLAAYHGHMWNDPRLSDHFPWLRTVLDFQKVMNDVLPYEVRSYVGLERAKAVIDPSLIANKEAVWKAHMRSLEIGSDRSRPITLVHWDVHIGNWYITPEGKMGLTDWNMNVGSWACDFSYAISTALTKEDRRAWEKDLLALYLAELARHGVADPPSFDDAWLAYRQQMFHALFYWTFPLGIGALQPRMQLPAISQRNVERTAQAIIDLKSMASVGF